MNIVEWAVSTMQQLGGPGVALLIFLENLFPPIPSEVILPLAGVTAAGEGHSFLGMLAWSVVGSLTGAWVLYGLGRLLGPVRLRAIFLRMPLIHVEDYDRTVEWMERHGRKGVLLGRMVPGVRSLVSIPAGLYAMPFWMFTLLTAIGSTIWNTIFVTFGYILGANWVLIEPYTDVFSNVVYAIIAIILIVWFVRLVRRELRRRREGLPDPDDAIRAREHAGAEHAGAEQIGAEQADGRASADGPEPGAGR
ncbi:DedA family protein [Brachybacterium sp. DNPG3]